LVERGLVHDERKVLEAAQGLPAKVTVFEHGMLRLELPGT
jgi:hypothetical protein